MSINVVVVVELVHVLFRHDILDNHHKYEIVGDNDSLNTNSNYMSNNDYHWTKKKLNVGALVLEPGLGPELVLTLVVVEQLPVLALAQV